jgi:hypothetical protein
LSTRVFEFRAPIPCFLLNLRDRSTSR